MSESIIEAVLQPEPHDNQKGFELDGISLDQSSLITHDVAPKPHWQHLLGQSKHIGQTVCAFVNVSPANEAIRLGVFGGIIAGVSRSPEAGALAYGLSTFVVEGVGAVAAAPLLETKLSKKFVDILSTKIAKFRKSEESLKLSLLSKATATFFGGTVVSMAIEQLEDNTRTNNQNLQYGLKVSAALAGICAVQGALMAEGVDLGIDHPQVFGPIVAAVAMAAGTRFAYKRFFRREEGNTSIELNSTPDISIPRNDDNGRSD
jgi:hypothetical protein